MRELFAAWRRWRDIIDEAQDLHARISERKEPTIADVLLPIAYHHLADARGDVPVTTIAGFAGHYLSQQYPELREYLLTPQQRARLSDLRSQLDMLLQEPTMESKTKPAVPKWDIEKWKARWRLSDDER